METIVPYKEEFKKYIPEQYKNSEKLLALVNSCMAQFDDIETAFFEILQSLNLADAIGPALDYLGAIVGVKRNPGESDTHYRERIVSSLNLLNLPGPEALRMVIKFLTGVDSVGLFPNWPAEMYYVLDGSTDANLSNIEKSIMTSGVSLVRGTFLCAEEGEGGYIVNDDNGMPFVVDYVEGADIQVNVLRFTFSKSDYDPTVAGVGPNGTWTKVETSNKNEWDWTGTPESYEFHSAFLIDATDISLTNWVSVRCNGWTEETDMSGMFNNCTAIVSAKMYGMIGVTNMYTMFEACSNIKELVFNGAVNNKNIAYLCHLCDNLEKVSMDTVGTLDCEDSEYAYNMYYTFSYCYKLKTVNIADLSSVKTFYETFDYCTSLEDIYLDIPNCEKLDKTFIACENLKHAVLKNTNNVKEFVYTFLYCTSMEEAPEMDTSGATEFEYVFKECASLKTVPSYNLYKVENMIFAFDGCSSLEYLPSMNTPVLEYMTGTFKDCTSLKEVPKLNTSKVRKFGSTFYNCISLVEIPEWLDVSSCDDCGNFFESCINVKKGIYSLYRRLKAIADVRYLQHTRFTFLKCGLDTTEGISELLKIPYAGWGGLFSYNIPDKSLLFLFGDENYDPSVTTTSNNGTWSLFEYPSGYTSIVNKPRIWVWTYDSEVWNAEFGNTSLGYSYLSDYDGNPVDVVAHGDLTGVKCYVDLFCRASALRSCCDFVIPDASVSTQGYGDTLQGMFSRCDNLEVFPHIDVTNLKGGIRYIADKCTKLTTIKPPTIRSTVEGRISAGHAFEDCPNVERGAAETYMILHNITNYVDDCFTNCGVNKLTGVSDLFKIPTSWGGLGLVSGNSVVFAFGDENYNPTTASVGAGGTWTELASNPTDFNIWTWTKSGNDWSGELENGFADEVNKPYILAIGTTGSVANVDNFLKGSTYIRHGALDMYRQMSGQATPPGNHEKTFHDCGKLTEQGLFELLQIPVNWGGDILTFCIENNLVAYLPDENQTEVLVQSIRYYQDVFRMMKNSDL